MGTDRVASSRHPSDHGYGIGGPGPRWAACWRHNGKTYRNYFGWQDDASREARALVESGITTWATARRPWINGKRR